MPIRKELRHFYRTVEYKAARERIVKRSGNKCEQCGKPNHRRVWVIQPRDYLVLVPRMAVRPAPQHWSRVKGDGQRWWSCRFQCEIIDLRLKGNDWKLARRIRVICTMAHLDHDPANNNDSNLKFLCQWCHLNYDKLHHKETRMDRKDRGRPLLLQATA